MLLNHTSGVADYATANFWNNLVFPNPYQAWQPSQLVQLALQQASVQPGTVYEYCNTGYILAGMIAKPPPVTCYAMGRADETETKNRT